MINIKQNKSGILIFGDKKKSKKVLNNIQELLKDVEEELTLTSSFYIKEFLLYDDENTILSTLKKKHKNVTCTAKDCKITKLDGTPFEQTVKIKGKKNYIKNFKEDLQAFVEKLVALYYDFQDPEIV